MVKRFSRMDNDITELSNGDSTSNCRCELQTPQCDAVGSTAFVAVVAPDKIFVSNCGDSRAILYRNGVAIPLSVDHKPDRPDRPDELLQIEEADDRVIYWDGARVLGILDMSRAIGDNYLNRYVIPKLDDEYVFKLSRHSIAPRSPGSELNVARGESSDKACSDASIHLTKFAFARRRSDNVSVV